MLVSIREVCLFVIMHECFRLHLVDFPVSLVQFRCCGVTNHTDWFEVYNATRVPDSCCLEYSDNCGLDNPGTWWTAVRTAHPTDAYNVSLSPRSLF